MASVPRAGNCMIETPLTHSETTTHSERKPYAFDLSHEYAKFQEFGEAYRPFFITEAGYYAKEAWGKVPKVMYKHSIIETPDGKRLWIDAMNCSARESYFAPAADESLPLWFRERAQKDGETIVSLEEWLQTARPGDICFDQSPTEFNVSIKEREKWGYGWHSFTRLHQLVEVDGRWELHSRAKRHYLNEQQQYMQRGMLATEPVGRDVSLMGTVIPADPTVVSDITNTSRFDMLTDECYQSGPQEERIVPPPQELKMIENDKMDEYLALIAFQLEEVADLMITGDQEPTDDLIAAIQTRFQGWEMFLKTIIDEDSSQSEESTRGADLAALRRFAAQQSLGIIDDATEQYVRSQQLFYQNKSYDREGATSGCGGGSGWGNKNNLADASPLASSNPLASGRMDYKTLTEESERHEDYECPKCHTKIQGEKKGSDRSTWTKKCPNSNCDHTFNC